MERNRKAGSKSSRPATINNTEFIKAVALLKSNNIITEDKDISIALKYNKALISCYLNNKRKAPELFMIKFNNHYFPAQHFNGSTAEILSILKDNQHRLQNIEKQLKTLIK